MEFDSIHHLFSIFITLYTLILLYLPSFFLSIALSPVLNSTGIILLSLLRLGANKLQKESELIDSNGNERLEKESSSSESGVLDCKDDHSNLTLYLVQESKSVESRFLDLVTQNQTHAEFEDKTGLGLESNQTHVDYEPKSGLQVESNETHVEFEHDMSLESMESSQVLEGGPKMEFEHDMGLESNSMESSEVIKRGQKKEMDPMQVDTKMAFLEWNMRAPLEIIYEAYEGEEEEEEEEEEDEVSNENHEVSSSKKELGCERHQSLLMYYPESETDSSSDGDFPMNEKWETHESVFFKWEDEEEDREELIEISLDRYGKRSIEFCRVEEDNLIEIDLFSTRN